MSSWVQYKNDPNGQKWELADTQPDMYGDVEWIVKSKGYDIYHYLPKSEFVPCSHPEQWEDVTGLCAVSGLDLSEKVMQRMAISRDLMIGKKSIIDSSKDIDVMQSSFYRVTKIDGLHNGPAFIVERKRS